MDNKEERKEVVRKARKERRPDAQKPGPKPYKPLRRSKLRRLNNTTEKRMWYLLAQIRVTDKEAGRKKTSIDDLYNRAADFMCDYLKVPQASEIE